MSLTSTEEKIFRILDQLIIYLSFIILFFGLIGNFFNIIVFTNHKSFHKNPCVFYFIIESTIDCIQLLITFTSRIGIIVFNYDPTQTSLAWCKIRSMIAQACTLISMTTVCFAVIDQYLSTNPCPRLRRKSTLELARALICINISIWLLYGIPFLLFFEIQHSLGCAISNPAFLFYYTYFHLLILIGFLPVFVGTIFSILAYRNVRRIIQRQITHIQRRLDQQLTAMVLARVTFLIIVTLPFVINRIYSLIVPMGQNETLRKEIESRIWNFTVLIFAMNFSV
jgi:hypothetical protein